MLLGQRFGNPFGDTWPELFGLSRNPTDGKRRLLSWTPEHEEGVVYHLYFDGVWQGTLSGTSVDLDEDTPIRQYIEVIESSVQNADEDCSRFAHVPAGQVLLEWTSGAAVARYELYRSGEAGSYGSEPIHAAADTGEAGYTYVDAGPDGTGLLSGTWFYRVRAYDAVGNWLDSNEESVVVSGTPSPPTAFPKIIWDGEFQAVTLSWFASEDPSVEGYNVYRSPLEGEDPIPLDEPIATTTGEFWWEAVGTVTGTVQYLVRAYNAEGEEANIRHLAFLFLEDGEVQQRPNSPFGQRGEAIGGRRARLWASYSRNREIPQAEAIRFYANDGQGGAVDFSAPLVSAALSDEQVQEVSAVTPTLQPNRTYVFVARAVGTSGLEDGNTVMFSVEIEPDGLEQVTLSAQLR
jgi:hypothetical protein